MNIIYMYTVDIYNTVKQPYFLLEDFKGKRLFINCANKILLHKFNFSPSFLHIIKKFSWHLCLYLNTMSLNAFK
jgi:hypothetical protein